MVNRLLPYNASVQEIALEQTTGNRIESIPLPLKSSWNPDTCPVELLPWLAWAFSVDVWDHNWTEFNKRKAIKDSAYVHQRKGTIGALKRALTLAGFSANVIERPEDEPYTFNVVVNTSESGVNEAQHALCLKIINETKNVRSWLLNLQLAASITGTLNVVSALNSGSLTKIYPEPE